MKKLTSFSLSLCIALNLAAPSLIKADAADMSLVDSGLDYSEQTDYDTKNFDCGYTSASWINAAPGKIWTVNPSSFTLLLIGIGEYSSALNSSGTDYDLDEAFFTSLEETLKNAKANGVTVGIRLRYDANGNTDPEPATFQKVLDHIDQLGASGLLRKYEEVITYIETGLVGSWGEQWGGKYTSLECKAEILEKFLEITPDSISVSVRTPNTVRTWLSTYCGIETTAADMSCEISDPVLARKFERIGLYNDAYMGSDSDLGTYSNRAGETAWLSQAAMYGGEFSGSDEWRMKYITWQPEYSIPEMYYTNLSHINSNLYRDKTASEKFSTYAEAQERLDSIKTLYESAGLGDFDYAGYVTEKDGEYTASWKWMGYDDFTFTRELDDLCGVDCDNSAFYGETVWQFMRAHIGYRYVLRSSKLNTELDPGDTLSLSFDIENTGFSNAPKEKEAEIILSDGTVNYSYTTDIDTADWKSGTKVGESLDIELPETISGGSWNVYLRVSNLNKDAADDELYCTRFANNSLQFSEELGANLLGTINVSGEPRTALPENPDSRAPGCYWTGGSANINDNDYVSMLDKNYTFTENDHYGFTVLYKIDGITADSVRLGNWYLSFKSENTGYASAYTTYGLNTLNLTLTENGCYLLNIPFYGALFNFTGPAAADSTTLTSFGFNDSRNYWSADTYTIVGNNSPVITPIGIIEGSPEGYSVTYHLADGDVVYTGSYGLSDVKTQTITNKPAVTALSLLDKEYPKSYIGDDGMNYNFVGFTTKKDDMSCIIDENFIAIGNIELYPYYEVDKSATNFSSVKSVVTNYADPQGIVYTIDEKSGTASVGDGSAWENNSGYYGAGGGNIIIPAFIEANGKIYAVTSISDNAFGSNDAVASAIIPNTVTNIGENAFYCGTQLFAYEDNTALGSIKNSVDNVTVLDSKTVRGDVNFDTDVNVADLVALNKYVLGTAKVVNTPASDLVEDSQINAADLICLRKILFEQNNR